MVARARQLSRVINRKQGYRHVFIKHFSRSPSCAQSAVDSESDDEQPPPPPPSGDPSAPSSLLPNDDDEEQADAEKDSEWMWDDFMDAVEENDADGVTLLLDSVPPTSREEVLVTPIP